MKNTRVTLYPAILGATIGMSIVVIAPSRNATDVVAFRPTKSKTKPMTKTVGIAIPCA